MRAQRQRRRLRRLGIEHQMQRRASETIGRGNLDLAGEALVAIRADQPERDAFAGRGHNRPELLAKADRTAMQGRAILVLRQGEGLTVDGHRTAGNAVGIAAEQRAERSAVGGIVGGVIEAEQDMIVPAARRRRFHRYEDAAVIGDARPELIAFDRIEPRGTAGHPAKIDAASWRYLIAVHT